MMSMLETKRICYKCGYIWCLPFSILKEIVIANKTVDILRKELKTQGIEDNDEIEKHLCITKECPNCSTKICVYHEDPDDIIGFLPKRKKRAYIKCLFKGHDFKGNLKHSIYQCKHCDTVIRYMDAKIKYLN